MCLLLLVTFALDYRPNLFLNMVPFSSLWCHNFCNIIDIVCKRTVEPKVNNIYPDKRTRSFCWASSVEGSESI